MVRTGEARKPLATGTLKRTPFAHVLLTVLRRKLSGTLVLYPTSDRPGGDRIVFADGLPVTAELQELGPTLAEGLIPLFRELGDYAFYEDADFADPGRSVAGKVDTLALIAESVRGPRRNEVVDAVLARIGEHTALRLTAQFDLERLALRPEELVVIGALRQGRATVAKLVERSRLEPSHARALVYVLIITAAAKVVGQAGAVHTMAPSNFSSVPPRPQSIRTAAPPRSTMAARPTEPAPSGGSQPSIRLKSPRIPKAPRSPQMEIGAGAPDDRDDEFRQIEGLMRRGNWDEALSRLGPMVNRWPDDADAHAALAWCMFNRTREQGNPQAMLHAVDVALRKNRKHDRAHFYKGMILKRMGHADRAMMHFKAAVASNQGNIDAKRELHLARKRGALR